MTRRRCIWCAIGLSRPRRWWARYCRRCGRAMSEFGIYLQNGGPPCPQGALAGHGEPSLWVEMTRRTR